MIADDAAPYAQLAVRFAQALVARNFDLAHTMLSAGLRKDLTPEQLRQNYDAMIQRGNDTLPTVELIATLVQWPDRRKTDIGWAYVAISGASYAEAVTVIVKQESKQLVIRHIEWGRP